MKQFQKIPSGSGEAEYIEKKSRFISHVFYVETAEEANEKLKNEGKSLPWGVSRCQMLHRKRLAPLRSMSGDSLRVAYAVFL